MSHATADLEYFMCDMCHTYIHRDIYCPHRRECKGRESQELKKGEVLAIRSELDDVQRKRTISCSGCQKIGTSAEIGVVASGISLDKAQRIQEMRIRRLLEDRERGLTAKEILKLDEEERDRSLINDKPQAPGCVNDIREDPNSETNILPAGSITKTNLMGRFADIFESSSDDEGADG
eukprot:Tbor_TRINITY_DN5927_c2_g3::TRINITY_DN5927_c2_g3_i1::g.18245::m.18245